MQTRFSFGGDEHIFAEVGEAMSLEAFFKSLFVTNALRDAKIKGVTEICPANASYQVKFDPDQIKPDDLLTELKRLDTGSEKSEPVIKTRIIEIPVLYNDPWTNETLMRFRERHQDPNGTDLEYAARINGLDSVDAFIKAHSSAPWFVSMVGFVAGLPFLYQMVERKRQLQAPKYLRPRTGHAQAHRRARWMFQLHLFSARCWRLPDVRHHADADLRSKSEDQLSARLHVPVQAGRHREVEADRQGSL